MQVPVLVLVPEQAAVQVLAELEPVLSELALPVLVPVHSFLLQCIRKDMQV